VKHSLQTGEESAFKALPDAWQLTTAEHAYSISTQPLRSMSTEDRHAGLAITWLSALQDQIRSYVTQEGQPVKDSRNALKKILARSEFAAVAPPSAWDLFKARFYAAIGRILERLFHYVEQHPTGSEVVFWSALSLAVVGLGMWLLRLLQSRGASLTVPRQELFNERIRPWKDWLIAAKQAAEQGDYKEAIHSGYWAAVLHLQQTGELPVELTNTPRERLSLMRRAIFLDALTNVTKALERFWYAGQPASRDDIQTLFQQLEAMECKGD
jgi:hypothetical protein